ncbi:hypothetical protein V8J88_08455 [Massilia sp. W12]|uniref:hypothetical protein n=1 Tax=Massilia sp. W12 TaxID=3126507 RepID=UPI0030CD9960
MLLFAWPWHPSHWWGWGVLCFMSVPLLTLFASFWHVVAQAFARSKATMYLSAGEIFWRRTKFAILLLSYLTLIGLVSHWLGGFL